MTWTEICQFVGIGGSNIFMYKSVRYIGVRGWYCSCLIGVTHGGFDININEVICLLLVCLETVNCSITRGTEPPLNWMSSANSRCPLGIQIDIPKFFQHFGSLSPYTTLDYQIDSTCPADWTQVDRFSSSGQTSAQNEPLRLETDLAGPCSVPLGIWNG